MEKKLTIAHIAPYLPYGLNVAQSRNGKMESYLLYGIKYSDYAKEWTVFIDDSRHGDYQNVYLKGVTPILNPLSWLTKEIEHNGERFVPYKKLGWESGDMLISCVKSKTKKDLPYRDAVKLFEWGFDVFSLIPQGLAIEKGAEG